MKHTIKILQKYKRLAIIGMVGLNLILTGCTSKKFDVNFKIKNSSSSDIFVEYVNLANNNDTSTIQIFSSETQIIYTAKDVITDDWYWVNDFSINHIINFAGDTIVFNPNASHYWVLSEPDYILDISNSAF